MNNLDCTVKSVHFEALWLGTVLLCPGVDVQRYTHVLATLQLSLAKMLQQPGSPHS